MGDKPEQPARQARFGLRPICAADDAQIAVVLEQTYRATEPDAAAQLLRRDPAVISVAYSAPRAAYFVVIDATTVVGGAGIAALDGARSEVCELRDMGLLVQARGQGAARELVEHCLAVALAFGYRHCYAELTSSMRPALGLLEHLKFSRLNQPVGRTDRYLCDRWYLRDL